MLGYKPSKILTGSSGCGIYRSMAARCARVAFVSVPDPRQTVDAVAEADATSPTFSGNTGEVGPGEAEEDVLLRVPLDLEVPNDVTLRTLQHLLSQQLEEAGLQALRPPSALFLALNGHLCVDPKAQPLRNLVPGSVVSLVEDLGEAQEVARLGLCLNAVQLLQVQYPTFAPPGQQGHQRKMPEEVLREKRQRLYKTQPCANYAAGHCTFGHKCHFAHGEHELRLPGKVEGSPSTSISSWNKEKSDGSWEERSQWPGPLAPAPAGGGRVSRTGSRTGKIELKAIGLGPQMAGTGAARRREAGGKIPAGDSRTGKIVKMASGSATVMPWRPEAMLALSEMWGRSRMVRQMRRVFSGPTEARNLEAMWSIKFKDKLETCEAVNATTSLTGTKSKNLAEVALEACPGKGIDAGVAGLPLQDVCALSRRDRSDPGAGAAAGAVGGAAGGAAGSDGAESGGPVREPQRKRKVTV
eukprot:s2720_g10.t1